MSFLKDSLKPMAKLMAYSAKFSARHPIHFIFFSLLVSSIAYLSVIHYYVNGWKLGTSSIYSSSNPDSDLFFEECTHYYRSPSSDVWSLIPSNEASKLSVPKHYYLFNLQFDKTDETTPLPKLNNVFYETEHSKYILQEEIYYPTVFEVANGKKWRLSNNRNHFLEIQHLLSSAYERFAVRFSQSEPFDIFVIASAYLMVAYTIFSLFKQMSKTGSRFWLSLATLLNSACALFVALYTVQFITKTPVPASSLIEGLPFILVIIGFKHKIRLAQFSSEKFQKIGLSKKMTIDNIIYDSMLEEAPTLIHDHLLCIIAFVGCSIYASHLESLANFCILCALILTFELFFTATFYSAVLSLKLEIHIIYRSTIIKQALEEDGVIPTTAELIFGAENKSKNSLLGSSIAVNVIKISVVVLFIGVNLYNFGIRWASETVSYLYNDSTTLSLPEFISSGKSSNFSDSVIISMAPIQYYENVKTYHKIEDNLVTILSYFSSAIRDSFVSKVIFAVLAVSASVNIYLLNATRIHTKYTADELTKRKAKNQIKRKSISKEVPQMTKPSPVVKSEPLKSLGSSTSICTNVSNFSTEEESESDDSTTPQRSLEELEAIMKAGKVSTLKNNEVVSLVVGNKLPLYALEKQLGDTTRAVVVRRKSLAILADAPVLSSERLPYKHYDYDRVFGACCENVIGFMPLPVGVIGPMIIDGVSYHIPMATTEGCLVASAMRGCKAINAGGGAITVVTKDGMTRGPCVRFATLARAGACKIWLDSEDGQNRIKKAFNSTSRFARLQHIQTALAGDLLFIRFRTTTGDAMGMNMISKGVEFSLNQMVNEFGWDDMEIVSVSGNYCTDKKPAAINWIEGRGKSIVAEATIPGDVVRKVLKSDVAALVELNISKNLIGSAMAGSVGGFNAHAANLVTAVYLALGQDPAQNVESSNCITLMKEVDGNLRISVSMPSIEVGTIGGGTILEPQGAMLDLLGVRGPHPTEPGTNARQLARIVACAVLAGELSLCAALAAGHLVQSHMVHNRAKAPATTPSPSPAITPAPAPAAELSKEDIQRMKEGSVTCIKS
ncbi:hypothetical protein Kpol_1001p4 [Vanderwaltozyma polyspora DSM 70294]|uniref:3-hydroxy-3-methylglutaryl coenzyme A reductase n=1 Tax=Vanderwaltozyma polyspora (strain ATCC 22028 / DSM 70294 / BCRC 21397 / CBS 2163 / NBRC 10782 / NRRL Y-8283 / UCD 57-17) TaxID=436907 RepID=A7TNP1_VANPO|nr:uncharacterized protein Kpol_1001p4 [Vanderwaltozyma polyspora DSM 70294]EDO16092.1 hypothetical protein Kpol_1001p4 [Vanderwaltozyma polyspora DSM 70294]